MPRGVLGFASVAAVLVAWEAVTRAGWLPPLFLPPLSDVLTELGRLVASGELARSLALSLQRIALGWLLGSVAGFAVGLLVGLSPVAEGLLDPLIALTYPIPKIAILPLLILWLGIGEPSKVAVIAIGCFFPVAVNTAAGVRRVDPVLTRAARSLGARPWQVLTKVTIMAALPMVFAGLRLAAGMALLLVVSAEMIAAQAGIGFLVLQGGALMLVSRLMAGLVVLSLLGIASTWLLQAVERRVVRGQS
ncbi:ABC transporter permease [Geochorda subterranea]|uniref:ABC transporter permease n=1 Tax=Geochorda subterranea TaxID=3109564 RepID=A0ABZ1BLQ0_9FIRM|nr:ABC transporter permease [Limnochorda sp. LNt]WRP13752.1 ABC transporter permease [Limnochorda sp. LNt]